MSKKSRPSKQKKSIAPHSSSIDKYSKIIENQLIQGDYAEAVANCERLLNFLPQQAVQRADVLAKLGTAHGLLQHYHQSFNILTEALSLDSKNAELWFNRGMSSLYIIRIGQAFKDFTRASELNKRADLAENLEKALKFSREMVEQSLQLRGPGFTLDQLIEQEDLFQRGLKLLRVSKWDEAGLSFQASIALGDCLPQPWGNLGLCFLMQERYDQAEAALKRALVIDPEYTLAQEHLTALPECRLIGPPEKIKIQEPFQESKMRRSLLLLKG